MKEKFTLFRRAAFLLLLAVTFGTLSVQAQELSATKSKVSALSKDVGFTVRKFQKSDPKASKISAQKMADRRAKARTVRKAPANATFFEDFEGITEEGALPEGWTAIDADGDGFNWKSHINTGSGNHTTHSGDVSLYSESYSNDRSIALTPDNWLITPKVALGGTLRVWAIGQDPNYFAEHFAFYVSVTGNTDVADFVQIAPASGELVATGAYVEYIADLSAYAGREGYIAIRHFNVSDEFMLVIDDFAIVAEMAPPTELQVTDITASEATVSWSGSFDSYNVFYRYAGNPTGATYFQDFEQDIDDWSTLTMGQGDGWELKSYGGDYGQVACSESWASGTGALNVDNWLISPKLTLGGTLKYWEYVSSSYPDSYEVLLSTTGIDTESFTVTLREMAPGTGNWNEVSIDLSAYEGQEGYIAIHHVSYDCFYLLIDNFGIYGEPIPAGEWMEVTTTENSLNLTGLEQDTPYEVMVQGVIGENTGTTDVVQFTTLATYPAPTNVIAENITYNSADLSWKSSGNETGWQLVISETPLSDPAVEGTVIYLTEPTYSVSDLTEQTNYYFYVRAVYDEGNSKWVSKTFTTAIQFPAPNSVYIYGNKTYHSFGVQWNTYGTETGWEVIFSTTTLSEEELETATPNTTSENHFVMDDLLPDTWYQVYVRAIYEGGASVWYTPGYATTSSLPVLSDVAVSDIDNESAVVTWTAPGPVDSYKVRYRTAAIVPDENSEDPDVPAGEWIEGETTGPMAWLDGLEDLTEYEVQVQFTYKETASEWSDAVTFKTLDKWSLPTQLEALNITTDGAVITWYGHADSYYLRYRTVDGETESEWSETVYNIVGHFYELSDLLPGTKYEVQLGAYYKYDESIGMEVYNEWTPSLFFTTLAFTPWPDLELTYDSSEGDVVGEKESLLSGVPADNYDYAVLYITNTNLVNVADPDDQLILVLNSSGWADSNLKYYSPLFVDGQEIEYTETDYGNEPILTLAGQTFEYIYIDNYGTEDDFAAVKDVLEGKFAVCNRGSISFYIKANAAMANGAAGIIIVNNQEGTVNMSLDGYEYDKPAVSVPKNAGTLLKEKAEYVTDGDAPYYRGTLEVGDVVAGHDTFSLGYGSDVYGTTYTNYEVYAYVLDWTNATPGATYTATITYHECTYYTYISGYDYMTYPIEIGTPSTTVTVVIPEENSIEGINTDRNADGRMFNLLGVPVGKDYKGIVIQNGKKVLIK